MIRRHCGPIVAPLAMKHMRALASLAESTLPQSVPEIGSLRLPRAVLAVHGRDSSNFLNGLLTTRPPDDPESDLKGRYSAMLNAKGRVVADTFVFQAHDMPEIHRNLGPTYSGGLCYLLDVDATLVDRILRTLDFHILAADVHVEEVSALSVWTEWDDSGAAIDFTGIEDKRALGLGHRFIAPREAELTSTASLAEWTLRRYLLGVPEGAAEIQPDRALPLEYCIDYMGGIDFDKGCYLGQELTIRTHHHGAVRKRVAPVVFTAESESVPEDLYIPKDTGILPGALIDDASPVPNEDKVASMFSDSPFATARSVARPAGKVVATLGNVGLAVIRLDKLGHVFQTGNLCVHALTPFWWPDADAPS